MEVIKNPIIIGLVAGTLTYAYLTWDASEKNEKNKKRSKKNYKEVEVNLLIPLVVAVIGWFIAYTYFQYNNESNDIYTTEQNSFNSVQNPRKGLPLPLTRNPGYRFVNDVISESSEPKSFSLLTGNGVTIPTKLPDVLIDMY